ncbi:hypothetical protein CKO28_04710 [Rhodovibrio sodomensis]|uniref:Bartonella effector protein BID domain-containing protein n=1 Tax=Rhodovibrio sodomensis TaxID=1088 RepID=A0ABS1DA60_9PROT|nr:hypothetical protein [Rhodovibrio sodomensis]MBK1667329.1 hypothetical protein [Rhodovibrio sodomensis]
MQGVDEKAQRRAESLIHNHAVEQDRLDRALAGVLGGGRFGERVTLSADRLDDPEHIHAAKRSNPNRAEEIQRLHDVATDRGEAALEIYCDETASRMLADQNPKALFEIGKQAERHVDHVVVPEWARQRVLAYQQVREDVDATGRAGDQASAALRRTERLAQMIQENTPLRRLVEGSARHRHLAGLIARDAEKVAPVRHETAEQQLAIAGSYLSEAASLFGRQDADMAQQARAVSSVIRERQDSGPEPRNTAQFLVQVEAAVTKVGEALKARGFTAQASLGRAVENDLREIRGSLKVVEMPQRRSEAALEER